MADVTSEEKAIAWDLAADGVCAARSAIQMGYYLPDTLEGLSPSAVGAILDHMTAAALHARRQAERIRRTRKHAREAQR